MIRKGPHIRSQGRILVIGLLALAALAGPLALMRGIAGQDAGVPKVGERLTYVISFNNYDSAGFAEVRVVSKGTLEGRPAVELYGKIKTFDLLNAAFFSWDEERTTYIAPDSGFPLYVRETARTGITPGVEVRDYMRSPVTAFDLLSLVFKARESGGSGSFTLIEKGGTSQVDLSSTGGERVVTEAGEFETVLSGVQGTFFSEAGINDLRINFSADDRRIPVRVRFATSKGGFEARLASIQDLAPASDKSPSATPVPTATPVRTPTPEPTPRPYQKNRPLSEDLPFRLGEKLRYSVTKRGAAVGEVALEAAERDLYGSSDALRLSAFLVAKGGANDIFADGDVFESWVDPDSLAPFSATSRFSGYFAANSQASVFDQAAGTVVVNGGAPVPVPVGTHNLLSLAYAVRAFNLRGSVDPTDPSNDTRVAIFVGGEPVILTLRPTGREVLEIAGRKRPAQMITIRSGSPEIDRLNIRLWLSADFARVPLRLAVGEYQADLLSVKTEPPKQN